MNENKKRRIKLILPLKVFLVIALFFCNFQIIINDSGDLLKTGISFISNTFALPAEEDPDGGGGGGVGNHYAMVYYRTYNCGVGEGIFYMSCPCWFIKCLYGGVSCSAYSTCYD